MIDVVFSNTQNYINNMTKTERKEKGQFFTSVETARFMADMFSVKNVHGHVCVLDPGAGTGILSCALAEKLLLCSEVESIELTCYETDPSVLPVLKVNLEHIKKQSSKPFTYIIIKNDYILSQSNDFNETLLKDSTCKKYDLVIGNPPYLKIPKTNPVSAAMPSVVYGAPNLYFIFASMSLFNLKDNGEMVYIIPRSWTSGAYFRRFREYLFENGSLEQIHLFVSRDKVFQQEQVLQETMIIKVKKSKKHAPFINITSSESNGDFTDITTLKVPFKLVVSGRDLYVYLPTNEDEVKTLQYINRFQDTFPTCGIKMKTGIVVDFRQRDNLRREPGEGIVPLFYSQHIRDGRVNHNDSGKGSDWINAEKKGLVQANKNYVFCKRFTAKEERRRLQCGIYLAEDFSEYDLIGTQNKINYVDNIDGSPLTVSVTYGIYVLLNSTLYDRYYRVLNGSTQVNSTEINNMPVPPRNIIKRLGDALIKEGSLSTGACDKVLEEVLNGKNENKRS